MTTSDIRHWRMQTRNLACDILTIPLELRYRMYKTGERTFLEMLGRSYKPNGCGMVALRAAWRGLARHNARKRLTMDDYNDLSNRN